MISRLIALVLVALAAPGVARVAAPVAMAPTAADLRLRAIYGAEWAWRTNEFAQVMDGLRSKDGDHFAGVTPADWTRRKAYWTMVMAGMA